MVLLQARGDAWAAAVIESRPRSPIYTFSEPRIAATAGVDPGSGIQLPVAEVPREQIGYLKGTVAGITLTRIEAAIAEALEPLASSCEDEVPTPVDSGVGQADAD